jgi:hypothetical protein
MQDDDEAAFLAGADATPAPETPAAEPEKAAEAAPEAEEKPEATTAPEEAEKTADDADKPKQTPWFQKRIDELTREKHDARREAERLAQEISALRQPQTDGDGNPVQPPADPVAIARQMVEQQRFDDACNQIYEKGAADFTDFDQALANFRLLGGLPSTLIEAARETDAPHAVLYDLGKNPEEAARILSLPPIRMAAAVAKMAAKTVTPPAPKVSKAPEPVKPLGGVGRAERDPMSDDAPMDVWIKAHDEREAARRASR